MYFHHFYLSWKKYYLLEILKIECFSYFKIMVVTVANEHRLQILEIVFFHILTCCIFSHLT